MARPKREINAECGKRLKELLEETDTKQNELAELIHLSQQTISKIINGSANLTLEVAKSVINHFPEYRLSWLMDHDNFKTNDELESYRGAIDQRNSEMYGCLINGIRQISDFCGYYLIIDYTGMELRPSGLGSVRFSPISVNDTIYKEFEDDVIRFFSQRLSNIVERGH